MEVLLQQEVSNTFDEKCILTHCMLPDCILTGRILTDIVLLDCILAGSIFWQVYAFEKEVREVQEMVQRRETLPTGVAFMYLHWLPIQVLLFATNVCFCQFVFLN